MVLFIWFFFFLTKIGESLQVKLSASWKVSTKSFLDKSRECRDSGNGCLVVLSLAWLFRSYCKLWVNLSEVTLSFLVPCHCMFCTILSLTLIFSPHTLSGMLSAYVWKAAAAQDVSSIICAVSRESERATLQTGLLLQVWDQRPRPHQNPSHSTSNPSVFFNPTLYLKYLCNKNLNAFNHYFEWSSYFCSVIPEVLKSICSKVQLEMCISVCFLQINYHFNYCKKFHPTNVSWPESIFFQYNAFS